MQPRLIIPKESLKEKFIFDNIYWENPQLYDSVLLYQIGDVCCHSGFTIGNHTQSCYELSYIVSGKGTYIHQGVPYPVKEGDVFLCIPGEQHDGRADTVDPFRYFYIGFGFAGALDDDDMLTHVKRMFEQAQKPIVQDKFGIQEPFISIFNELINLKNYSTFMIKTYLYQIIVLGYRDFFDSWEKEYMPQSNYDEKEKIVYEVINYIDANLCRIIDLPSIAEELGYSYSHLSHVFSRKIGLTIKEYYDSERFKKAIEWLKESKYSITTIAEKLQYRTIHTFSKAFRRTFGISPSEYQSLYFKNK